MGPKAREYAMTQIKASDDLDFELVVYTVAVREEIALKKYRHLL